MCGEVRRVMGFCEGKCWVGLDWVGSRSYLGERRHVFEFLSFHVAVSDYTHLFYHDRTVSINLPICVLFSQFNHLHYPCYHFTFSFILLPDRYRYLLVLSHPRLLHRVHVRPLLCKVNRTHPHLPYSQ